MKRKTIAALVMMACRIVLTRMLGSLVEGAVWMVGAILLYAMPKNEDLGNGKA